MLLIAFVPAVFSAPANASSKSTDPMANPYTGILIVQLKTNALAEYGPALPTGGGRIDVTSPSSQNWLQKESQDKANLLNFIQSNNLNAQVIAQYSIVLNAVALRVNNVVPDRLVQGGVAVSVDAAANYQTDMDISASVVGLTNTLFTTDLGLWAQLGGHANAGLGMKIGVIDTGIDTTSPFLTDGTLAAVTGFPKCDALDSSTSTPDSNCLFVSNKVLVAKVFQSAYGTSFTAAPAQAHGSHVSGIAAGVFGTTAPLSGSRVLSGIAPKAYLGNYNVFPGNITNSYDVDIIAALEAALADGMDVVNLSLGGSPSFHDPLAKAVNNVANAGMIPVIAAGNAGSGLFTIESPGIAKNAITVGASTNAHFFGVSVTVPSLGTFGGAVGDFAPFVPPITATYATTPSPGTACSALTPGSLTGLIALIARGTCTFSTKIRNAQNAGAVGAIIYNNVLGDPTAMGMDGTPLQPTIPAVMVSNVQGAAMKLASPKTVTVDGTVVTEYFTGNQDYMAGFSSRGPTPVPPEPYAIKPDLVAPGVNVYSSVPGGFAVFQGTSMATPHVAGAAALLKQLHPDWSVRQVKSALVNSAARPAHLSTSTSFTISSVLARGGGRLDLTAAGLVTATLTPVSLSFGSQDNSVALTLSKPVEIKSVDPSTFTYTLSADPVRIIATSSAADGINPQLTLSVSASPITLGLGGDVYFTVSLTFVAGTTPGYYQSDIVISGGTVTLRIPVFVLIHSP